MSATDATSRLVKALDANYQYRHGEMLRWFVSEALVVVGLPAWEPVPADAIAQIRNAIEVYESIVASEAPFRDVLGDVYMQLVSAWGKSALGQYFTPEPIAQLMAAMTGPSELPTTGLFKACDPAVGSGVMMSAFLRQILETQGPDALKRVSVTGIDLDPVCIRMFALQMLANCNIHRFQIGELLAFHGNALGDLSRLTTILHASAPGIEVAPARHPKRLEAIQQAAVQRLGQLSLFELDKAA